MTTPDDSVLVEKARRGDLSAFDELVRRYEKTVFNLAYRMVGDEQDAMDIVQEVFVKVYQSLSSFRGDSKLSTWLYRVCMNSCLDFKRKNKRVFVSIEEPVKVKDNEIAREVPDPSQGPEEQVESIMLGERVLKILDELDPIYKSVFVLSELQGRSYQEIADIMDVSLGTVKSRLHRARCLIKTMLDAEHFSRLSVKKS